jgi:hypothetical protein
VRMLQEQQHIVNRAGAPLFDQFPLQRERLEIRNATRATDLERATSGRVATRHGRNTLLVR